MSEGLVTVPYLSTEAWDRDTWIMALPTSEFASCLYGASSNAKPKRVVK